MSEMQSYNIELPFNFLKKFPPRKVLHVYAIYQKYRIIAFNPSNFQKNLFP